MKALVKVGDFAWLDPQAVDAVVQSGNGTVVVLSSGETITVPMMSPDDVLSAFEEAYGEVVDLHE